MHLSDNTLRSFLDHQLSQKESESIQKHLTECAICSRHFLEIEQQSQRVAAHLVSIKPHQASTDTKTIYQKLMNRNKEITMPTFFKRPVFAGLVILTFLLVSLAFSPVRALASNFLGLFRVEQVRVVTYDPAYLAQLSSGMENSRDQIETFFQNNITETHQGEFQTVGSVEEAAAAAGFDPRFPDLEIAALGVEPGAEINITLDTELINSMLTTLGKDDYQLSSEFNGKQVAVRVPTSVVFTSGNCKALADPSDPDDQSSLDCISFVQMPTPQANIPEGLDIARLGEAMLQILGMSPEEASAFSQSIDWSTTLVLPIPVGEGIQHQDVAVDGVNGSLITASSSSNQTLIWAKGGMLYAMNSSKPGFDLVALASNLK